LALQVEFLLDHGLQPTHLNGHQYIEMLPVVAEYIPQLLSHYNIHVVRVAEERSLLRSTIFKSHSPQSWFLAKIKQFFARRFHRRMEQLEVRYPAGFHGTAHAGKIDMPLIRLFLDDRDASFPLEIGLHPAQQQNIANSNDEETDGWTDPLAGNRPNELSLVTSGELAGYLEEHNYRLGRLSQLDAA
jgi:predicted glycoside hydrolase/deacetylase ChbG (UPF0249 family)